MSARRLPGLAARRERLGRERTAAQLRRQEALQAEVVEQLEPLLGPAGRPVGDTAMTLWRRRQVDAYLALPPWTRARRTWVSWGFARRAVAVLALAPLWTLVGQTLRAQCASPLVGGITPAGARSYRASLADGSVVTVAIDRSHGFDGGGSRGILSGGGRACSEGP